MKRGKLLRTVKGLPYRVGMDVPVSKGNDESVWLWHVHTTILKIPNSFIEILGDWKGGN
jgi:hypothetical protein